MRGMMGGFYKLSEWIMRLAVINLLWLFCGLPFWIVGLMGYLSLGIVEEDQVLGQLQQSVILLAVLAPVTFFPATSAMFSVARKWVTGDTDVPLLKTYFKSYRENFKQAALGGILYALAFGVLMVDFVVYMYQFQNWQWVAYLFVAIMILLLISVHHYFSLLAHFHMKTTQLLKNALILTIGRPFRSLFMTLGTIAVLYLSVQFTFLIPFFFGSIIAMFAYFNFHLIITKMMENAPKQDGGMPENNGNGHEPETQEMKN
jgi:uncharacterized membrane protein YesL